MSYLRLNETDIDYNSANRFWIMCEIDSKPRLTNSYVISEDFNLSVITLVFYNDAT
jgi:hypothetical protein